MIYKSPSLISIGKASQIVQGIVHCGDDFMQQQTYADSDFDED